MRFRSKLTDGFQVFAVTGTNTVSFGISSTAAARKGLLGFAVERVDPQKDERYWMYGFKVFPSVIPHPDKDTVVTTFDHPVQSFVWDDFTARPDHVYEYRFLPVRGKPKNLDRTSHVISLGIRTEPLFSELTHDVFFNRGVASSQAYARKFGNKKPDDLAPKKKEEALQWLSRDLDDAMLKFIDRTKKGEGLRCCFYEFRYLPVAKALKAAITRGVDVSVLVDAKVNGTTDKKGVKHPSFPRVDNLDTIAKAKIPGANVVLREAKPNDIQHNKFMVLLRGKKGVAKEVWTGSTNVSTGGIHGQTNVGHWVRDTDVADRFLAYWTLLSADPGGKKGNDPSTTRKKNAAFKKDVEALVPVPTKVGAVPKGVTCVFSPRSGLEVLDMYVDLVDSAKRSGAVTLAFGINATFKQQLKDNVPTSALVFLLLEQKDAPNKKSNKPFVAINASNNVYKAWGAFLRDPVYQWTRETNARSLQFNTHVAYIHSKFLLRDPLGGDPVVVTGSANFSDASTNDNDENMLVIRGDRRVADIYFTEFNRLFNHYYFRAVHEATGGKGAQESLFLREDDGWLEKYAPGKLRRKRVALYEAMEGLTPQP